MALMHAQPQLAIESPESPLEFETPKRPTTLNFYKKYDTEFLNTHGLPSANEFPKMTKDELEMITQKVTKAQKSVGGRKGAAKSTEKRDKLDGDLVQLK